MRKTASFFFVFVACIFGCSLLWQACFPGRIYHCTDSVGLDYLFPGDWVHPPVETVDMIVEHHDMSMPDRLKAGWTLGKLWMAWFGMLGASLIISLLLASRLGKGPQLGD